MPVKILLLDPPHKIFGALRMWMPSPGLMALAAYLESKCQTVELCDATTFDRPWTDLENHLRQGRYDIVGVTCSAATFHNDAVSAIRLARKVLPNAVILAGGGHLTLNADNILESVPEVDYIAAGEGEETFLELIRWLEGHETGEPCDVPGLIYLQDGKRCQTPSRPLIPDLDALPMPGYHMIDLNHPVYSLHGMGSRAVGISTSRGCGDHCTYCSEAVLWNSNWRGRSGRMGVGEKQML